jgi:hypothetical protein
MHGVDGFILLPLANLKGLPKVQGKKENGKHRTDKANQEIDFLGKGC